MEDNLPALSNKPASSIIKENLNALHKAREAFIQAEYSAKIKRALSHQIRTYSDVKYVNEDSVYCKRKDGSEWHGPVTVLGQDGQQVLVKHGDVYVRVHPCRLNPIKIAHQPSTQIDHSNISLQDKSSCQNPTVKTRYQQNTEPDDAETDTDEESNEVTTQTIEHDNVAETADNISEQPVVQKRTLDTEIYDLNHLGGVEQPHKDSNPNNFGSDPPLGLGASSSVSHEGVGGVRLTGQGKGVLAKIPLPKPVFLEKSQKVPYLSRVMRQG